MENGHTPTFHSVLRIQIYEMWMRLYEMRIWIYKMRIRIPSLKNALNFFISTVFTFWHFFLSSYSISVLKENTFLYVSLFLSLKTCYKTFM